jgi:hypothetical protein
MGAETRSAIRSFQTRQGLPITGLVGPDTERALIATRNGQSPGAGAAEFDFEWGWGKEKGPEGEANPIAAIDWCQMRQNIARIARAEERRWTRPDGSKFWENDPSRLPILASYWQTVPGFTAAAAAMAEARRSANDSIAWSAAFICFVMHTAGVRRVHGFEFSQRHLTYIVGALRNRERSDRTRVFWLADSIEVQNEASPEPGDLLCINRPDENGNMTRHSAERLRQDYWLGGNHNRVPLGASHCSIVVRRVERNGRQFIQTIGGNEGAAGSGGRGVTVGLREIPLDRFGGIPNPQAHNIFGIIKLIGC